MYNDEKFYKKSFYTKIRNLSVNKKYNVVITEATKYLEIYPDDSSIRFIRATAYRNLEMFNEAIFDLKYNLRNGDNIYSLSSLYYIYYYLNMYDEALNLLPKVYETKCIKPYSAYITELVMKKKLGIPITKKDGSRCDYIKNQIFSYSKDLAVNHIKEHLNKEEETQFNHNINLEYLFEFIRNNLYSAKKTNVDDVLQIYYFAISNIGYTTNSICNFLKVVAVPNTNDIITMYPVDNVDCHHINCIQIDYNELFNKNQKIKEKSRIQKFNEKYKLTNI